MTSLRDAASALFPTASSAASTWAARPTRAGARGDRRALAVSTVLTLVLIPTLYVTPGRARFPRRVAAPDDSRELVARGRSCMILMTRRWRRSLLTDRLAIALVLCPDAAADPGPRAD